MVVVKMRVVVVVVVVRVDGSDDGSDGDCDGDSLVELAPPSSEAVAVVTISSSLFPAD